jgi:hypothetical protein
MGKTYTIVFNSAIAADTSTSTERYYFDWSRLEDGKYKGIFTFVNGQVGQVAPTYATVPALFMDLGQGAYTQIASTGVPTSANIGDVYSPDFIGCLETRTLITGGPLYSTYYYAGLTTNPPFYLDNKPRNNNVQILIQTIGANGNTLYAPLIGAYTLTLQLEKLN